MNLVLLIVLFGQLPELYQYDLKTGVTTNLGEGTVGVSVGDWVAVELLNDIILKNRLTNEEIIIGGPDLQMQPFIDGTKLSYTNQSKDEVISAMGYDLITKTPFVIRDGKNGTAARPRISGDLVVWYDWRNGNADIYGKYLSTGIEFPICMNSANQWWPTTDGRYVVWTDERNGVGNSDIYAYDLLNNIEFPVTTDPSVQKEPEISDGIAVWEDNRFATHDIFGYNFEDGTEFPLVIDPYIESHARIGGGFVVWEQDSGIFGIDTTGLYETGFNTFADPFLIATPTGTPNLTFHDRYVVWADETANPIPEPSTMELIILSLIFFWIVKVSREFFNFTFWNHTIIIKEMVLKNNER